MDPMINKASVSERQTMIHLLRSGHSPTEVAASLNRSPAWVYKWRKRYFECPAGEALQERSRAPRRRPRQLAAAVRQAICQARSELEVEATEPGKLSYIGAAAVQARLKRCGVAHDFVAQLTSAGDQIAVCADAAPVRGPGHLRGQ